MNGLDRSFYDSIALARLGMQAIEAPAHDFPVPTPVHVVAQLEQVVSELTNALALIPHLDQTLASGSYPELRRIVPRPPEYTYTVLPDHGVLILEDDEPAHAVPSVDDALLLIHNFERRGRRPGLPFTLEQ